MAARVPALRRAEMVDTVRVTGRARPAGVGNVPQPVELTCAKDGLTIAVGEAPGRRAAYRDVATIAVQQGAVLLVLGEGDGALRLIVDGLGQQLGTFVQAVRERRLFQRLQDRLVDFPSGQAIDLVEYRAGADGGVAQLACHPFGVALAPLDERRPWVTLRRAEVERVRLDEASGTLVVDDPRGRSGFELLHLGGLGEPYRQRLTALRDAAFADTAAIVAGLIPDAPFAVRDRAGALLVDGRPCDPDELGAAWAPLESAVLATPPFAASYRALVERAGGGAALRWLAVAPEMPGRAAPRSWFFVALPGNLVALELVSAGAHATYCFRVLPRASYAGQGPASLRAAMAAAVRLVSEALVDARFLREPIGLPDARLATPSGTRYRLALAALPSLAAARAAFVARLVHRDEASWNAALDDLIRWHSVCRDDAAVWPGRAAQEAMIDVAGEAGSAGAASVEAGLATPDPAARIAGEAVRP